MIKPDMELATIAMGRYSTPYRLRKAVSAKLVKRMLELLMRKKIRVHPVSYTHLTLPTTPYV